MAERRKLERDYRAVLFDLFGTLVFFRMPPIAARHEPPEHLRAALERELPHVDHTDFLATVREVSGEIAAARRDTHEECSSPERFRRVLARLGIEDEAKATRISRAHMQGLLEATHMPAHHPEVLRQLLARYRVALVSNFDHGPTARDVLRRHDLHDLFEHIVISEEFGLRKPRSEIFVAALDALGVPASAALYVGDTPRDDIEGAHGAGIDSIWISAGNPYPEGMPPPTASIEELAHLRDLLL